MILTGFPGHIISTWKAHGSSGCPCIQNMYLYLNSNPVKFRTVFLDSVQDS
jgi:hypothetical protein